MVIDLSLTRSAEHARLFNAQPLESTLSSPNTINYFPPWPPGRPTSYKAVQKGEFKGWRIILVFSLSS